MDESWRMRMGMPSPHSNPHLPGRRSSGEDSASRRSHFSGDSSSSLDPINFSDVFGGPPRTVLSRQFSASEFSRQTFSYEEIFQQPFKTTPQPNNGRNLPEFRIPAGNRGGGGRRNNVVEEEFYGDIFGELRRSRSRSHQSVTKSKSNSSSVLSSEDFSPFRSAVVDEEDVSFFASKLRPINVSTKWNSSAMMHEVRPMPEAVSDFPSNRSSYFENQFSENEQRENFRSSHSGCSRKVSSPESIFLDPNLYCSIKVPVDDLQLNSPSSVVSSLCQDHETETSISLDQVPQEECIEQEDENEIMGSYVIEINLDKTEGTDEGLGIAEAIAWAKEKYRAPGHEKEWSWEEHNQDSIGAQEQRNANNVTGKIGGRASTLTQLKPEEFATEGEKQQLERDMELELLDEDVRMWSAGKETNIRLLLSTLHHILWPNSGWHTMTYSNLKESADVKKTYQKARLCLHPDKLQQRGSTFPQKYVAEKAFPILQDAWAAFISQDVFPSRS